MTNQGDFLKIGLQKDSLLIDLYNDTTHSGNESEEDMRLLSKLAYYCNKDSQAIRQAFESSPYFMTKMKNTLKNGTEAERTLIQTYQLKMQSILSLQPN